MAAYAYGTAEGTEGRPLVIEACPKSGDCFYIQDMEGVSTSYVGYQATRLAAWVPPRRSAHHGADGRRSWFCLGDRGHPRLHLVLQLVGWVASSLR